MADIREYLPALPAEIVAALNSELVQKDQFITTTVPITLFVDGVNGIDTNDGTTSEKAFATIQPALDSLPTTINNPVVIRIIEAGNYVGFKVPQVNLNSIIAVVADDSTNVVLDTGTIISNVNGFTEELSVAPAGRTGKTLRITSGPLDGYRRTVHSVSGSDATVMMSWSGFGGTVAPQANPDPGDTYEIVEPGVTIAQALDPVTGQPFPMVEGLNPGATDGAAFVTPLSIGVFVLANVVVTTPNFTSLMLRGSQSIFFGVELRSTGGSFRTDAESGTLFAGWEVFASPSFEEVTPSAVAAGAVDIVAWTGWGVDSMLGTLFIEGGFRGCITSTAGIFPGPLSRCRIRSAFLNYGGSGDVTGLSPVNNAIVEAEAFFGGPTLEIRGTGSGDAVEGSESPFPGGRCVLANANLEADTNNAVRLDGLNLECAASVTGSSNTNIGVLGTVSGACKFPGGSNIVGGTPGVNDFSEDEGATLRANSALVAGAAGRFFGPTGTLIYRN